MSLLFRIFGLIFLAELGDKTQFLMIAMASHYRPSEILCGVAAAILVLNGAAIALGCLLGGILPVAWIGLIAGLAFLWFAYTSVGGEAEEEQALRGEGKRSALWTVFGTFFLAELGDKTQLTVLTLAADHASAGGTAAGLWQIFFGATLALLAADVLGLLVGTLLGKTLPGGVFSILSYGIFSVFGILKLLGGLEALLSGMESGRWCAIGITVAIGIGFVGMTLIRLRKGRVRHGTEAHTANRESV